MGVRGRVRRRSGLDGWLGGLEGAASAAVVQTAGGGAGMERLQRRLQCWRLAAELGLIRFHRVLCVRFVEKEF